MNGILFSDTLSASALRTALGSDLPHGAFEILFERALSDNVPAITGWIDDASRVLNQIVNFLEKAMWQDGIMVGGFMPRPVLNGLADTFPLSPSVVPPQDHPDRRPPILTRLGNRRRES
ncbi:hypothetical protein JNB84_21740 [Rhizobium pusense]|uniref:hypothetical protein n=1 Tax=Agrobacterium pusense TaxID=648995 RepID=UPI001C6E893F|nr:hypothetical protein [Agrobacterium pusense]MBW9080590.1 hypothetical protein [Agrobacterium pusense]